MSAPKPEPVAWMVELDTGGAVCCWSLSDAQKRVGGTIIPLYALPGVEWEEETRRVGWNYKTYRRMVGPWEEVEK